MLEDILELLRLFEGRVPDYETHAWVVKVASDEDRWSEAHDVFDRVRDRNLDANAKRDYARECQYCFEEVCLKSIWNLTDTGAPFDPDSPHWITKNAIDLARAIGMSDTDVIHAIAPDEKG
jgi:hypothetical protein